jgi:site-specific DNA recombinase
MKQAVIYARVSSREQEQEGYSIQAQLKLLENYAAKNGFEIADEFIDIESAKAAGRTGFGAMLTFLKCSKSCRVVLVEKIDRLTRNYADKLALEKLGTIVHLVKTGLVVSGDGKASDNFMIDVQVAQSVYYSANLREEVKKGMREKAEQGGFPGHAPYGYVNNKITREVDVHPEESLIVARIFELYATGECGLTELRRRVRAEYGKTLTRSNIHKVLNKRFYTGVFEWRGEMFRGKHKTFIPLELFDTCQAVMHGYNKGKHGKQEIAFRGMLKCAHDDCAITGERKKGKYVYYRCTGFRGKCDLPRFREEQIAEMLGETLKQIHIPDALVKRISATLEEDQIRMRNDSAKHRQQLQQQLSKVRERMDKAYSDKLDGAITEDFWKRKMNEWQVEEQRIEAVISGLGNGAKDDRVLDMQRILELANKAYFLYLTRKPAEQAELLKKVLLNSSIDGVSLTPTYRKPFDMIFERAKREEWSGREDLKLSPLNATR